MIIMNRIASALQSSIRAVVCLCLLAGTAQAATYKWVDEEGNVQYSQSPPPPGVEGETIKPPPPPPVIPEAVTSETGTPDKPRDVQEQNTEQEQVSKEEIDARNVAIRKKNCQTGKDNLASYTRPRVRKVQEDGTRVVLTEEERQDLIKKAEAMIKEYCTD